MSEDKYVCIDVKDLTFSYERKPLQEDYILNGISLQIMKNEVTTLIGANGCGKSTFFNLVTKNLKNHKGVITIDGKNIEDFGYKEFAKKIAIVHQNNTAAQDIKVETLVGYGRNPYLSICRPMSDEDRNIVSWAMEVTDVLKLRNKTVMSLSGGQRQRVWIAMALAQKTEILLLDEPTTYLDIRYQIELLEMIKRINVELGITVVMVLHDMNHAIYYSDSIIGMKEGRIIAQGQSDKIIDSEIIRKIYGISLDVLNVTNGKIVVPVRAL